MANEMIQNEATKHTPIRTIFLAQRQTDFYLMNFGMKLTRIFTYDVHINHKKRLICQVYTYCNEFLTEILLFIIHLNP